MNEKIEREPVVVIIGAVIALIEAILLAAPLFGVNISAAQTAALMGIFGAAGVLGIALARQRVTPMARPRTAEGEDALIVKKQ